MIDSGIACSPAQHKRTRLFSPELRHGCEAKLEEWEEKQASMELREEDRDAHGHSLGKVAEDMESTPFYGDISSASTPVDWMHERFDKEGGDETIELMRGRIHYKDYRDERNLPSNSTSSIFVSETISNPHADQLILCMAVVVQMRILEQEQAFAGMELPSTLFDEKEPEEEDRATGGVPSIDRLYDFLTTIYYVARYSPECHIIALVYLSRIAVPSDSSPGVDLNKKNWRALVLTALILAQKVWDDCSLKTSAFSAITPYSKDTLKKFELEMLSLLAFQATVKVSRYAQHYFELRSLYENTIPISSRQPFPMRPLSIARAKHLQSRSETFSLHKTSGFNSSRCRTLEDVTRVDRTRFVLS